MTVTVPAPSWPRMALRAMLTIQTLLLFAQPVLIGGFLQGNYPWLALHQANAIISAAAAVGTLCAAVLCWRPGRGPAWPVAASLGIVAAIAVQTGLGFARVLIIHVPLGVAIVAASIRLLAWAWQPGRPQAGGAGQDPAGSPQAPPARRTP